MICTARRNSCAANGKSSYYPNPSFSLLNFHSCGAPIYANTSSITCRNCSKSVSLYLNPKIIGSMVDETGQILGGRLLWSPDAWKDFLGVKAENFVGWTGDNISLLEQRTLFIRMHFLVGWKQDIGKLCVLGVDQ